VTDLFERLVAASGLPPIRLHDLRHGAATLMLAAGIDVKIGSDTLGHSDTRITRDIYQSVLPQAGKNAAEAMAKKNGSRRSPGSRAPSRSARASLTQAHLAAPRPCDASCPWQRERPGHGLCDLAFTGAAFGIRTRDLRITRP
jgi:hypothetical protein